MSSGKGTVILRSSISTSEGFYSTTQSSFLKFLNVPMKPYYLITIKAKLFSSANFPIYLRVVYLIKFMMKELQLHCRYQLQ
jgi:hypothetical protein